MKDIVGDIDAVVLAEEEEQLMMDAEMERLQREATIALDTRMDGNMLLPFFETSPDLMFELHEDNSVPKDLSDEVHGDRSRDWQQIERNPFSVMTAALLKTLREPPSQHLESETVKAEIRTA